MPGQAASSNAAATSAGRGGWRRWEPGSILRQCMRFPFLPEFFRTACGERFLASVAERSSLGGEPRQLPSRQRSRLQHPGCRQGRGYGGPSASRDDGPAAAALLSAAVATPLWRVFRITRNARPAFYHVRFPHVNQLGINPARYVSRPMMVKIGSVSVTTHASESRSPMRVTIANASPSVRARWRYASGRRPTSIEMKMMLSTPRTTSSAVSVTSAIHASGSSSHSNFGEFRPLQGSLRTARRPCRRRCRS